MKLVIRRSDPKNDKDKMFRIEAEVNDLNPPGEAHVTLGSTEYMVEVHYDLYHVPPKAKK